MMNLSAIIPPDQTLATKGAFDMLQAYGYIRSGGARCS